MEVQYLDWKITLEVEAPEKFAGSYTITADALRCGPIEICDGLFAYDETKFSPQLSE